MRKFSQKPKLWEWLFYVFTLLLSIILANERFQAQNISRYLLYLSLLGFALSFVQQCLYWRLSPEKKREMDRMDTDERNTVIRGRAAHFTWMVMNVCTILICFIAIWRKNLTVSVVTYLLFLINQLSFVWSARWLDKKL